MTDLNWRNEKRKLRELTPWERNPRQLSHHDAEHIRCSIEKFGLADPLVVNGDGTIVGGHQRKRIMLAMEIYGPDAEVDVRVPSRALTEREIEELNIRLNRNIGDWDWDALANQFEMDDLLAWGFTDFDLGQNNWLPNEFEIPDIEGVGNEAVRLIVMFENLDEKTQFCESVGIELNAINQITVFFRDMKLLR